MNRRLERAMEPFDVDFFDKIEEPMAIALSEALIQAHETTKRRYLRTDHIRSRRVPRYAHEALDLTLKRLSRCAAVDGLELEAMPSLAEVKRRLSVIEPALERVRSRNVENLNRWQSTPEPTIGWYVPFCCLSPTQRTQALASNAQRRQWTGLFGGSEVGDDHPTWTTEWAGNIDGIAIHGDCLHAMRILAPRMEGRFACLYADPPYNTRTRRFAFDDFWDPEAWATMLRDRLEAALPLLTHNAWIWLQVDDRQLHRLLALVEESIGECVRNQVAWVYGTSARGAKSLSSRLPKNHDSILAIARDEAKLHGVSRRVTLTESEARRLGYRLEDGRWFKTAPIGDYTDESIRKLEQAGRIRRSRSGTPRKRYDLPSAEGLVFDDRPIGDVWLDIPDMMHAPMCERLGFPGQKPVALLKRVLSLSASRGDWVIDPFAGTGTTAVAAHELGMSFCVAENGPHFETLLLPRILRAMRERPGVLQVIRIR